MHTVANDSAYRIAFSLSEVMFYVSVICIYIVDLYIYIIIIIFSPSSPELVLKKILFGYFNSAKVVHISLPWFKLCPKMQQVKWLLTVYK